MTALTDGITGNQALANRVLALVDRSGECWEWRGYRDRYGYGRITMRDQRSYTWRAHRASWLIFKGAIPAGRWVLHHCDNKACVRPAHLYLGERSDNVRDAVVRQRYRVGSKSPQAVLTEQAARAIRARYAAGETQVAMAAEYGVTQAAISRLILRKSWRSVA